MDGTNVKDILSKRVDLSNYMEFDESLKEVDLKKIRRIIFVVCAATPGVFIV